MRESPDHPSVRDAAPQPPPPSAAPEPAFRIFLTELKRRGVYQVAAAYAVAGSVVIQLAPTLLDAVGLPPSATRVVVLATVAGFPVALVLAWLFQLATSVRREPRLSGPGAVRAAWLARVALVGVVLVAGAAAGAALWRPRGGNVPSVEAGLLVADRATAPAARIAVLYFDDLSPQGARDSLATLITANLISELKDAAPSLTVLSADAVRPYRGLRVAPDSIARALQVSTLVTGSVVRSAGRVRVDVGLVSGATGETIDNTVVERPDGELLSLADALVQDASVFLRRRLGAAIRLQEWRATTSSQKAWDLVRQAQRYRYEAQALGESGEYDAAAAVAAREDSLFAAAERADPSWTVATVQRGWLDLSSALVGLRSGRYDTTAPNLQRAIDHADRVLAREPRDAGALELRGNARRYLWLLARPAAPDAARELLASAERDLRTAVEQDPRRAQAWSGLSAIRLGAGDYTGAESAARRALQADAFADDAGEVLWRGFVSAFQLGRDDAARTWCDEFARRNRGQVIGAYCALKLAAWGDRRPNVDSAWARVRQLAESAPNAERPDMPLARIAMAGVLARAGLRDSARALLARAPLGSPGLLLPEAEARVLLGEDARATDILRRYLAAHPDQRAAILRDRCFSRLVPALGGTVG